VWGFTPTYLSGIYLFGLPLGEYLFFITVPFACIFIYKCLELFFPEGIITSKLAGKISQLLIPFSLAVGIISYDKIYTASTFILLGIALIYVSWIAKCSWLPRFYESYALSLLPFFLKNGILTGSFLESEVVWYNNSENLGIRIGTIPFEDIFYGMLLILGTLYFYEKFEASRKSRLAASKTYL
jgi:lycopene cyclase domain-containing protein